MISVSPAYKQLVILLAHMFYSGQCPPTWWIDASEGPKKETQVEEMLEDKRAAQLAREAKRKAQADTTGLGIIILTALTERQWVEEDEFARSLNLPPKMVRKATRYLEEEQLLMREHRKETKRARREERNLQAAAGLRDAKPASAAAAAPAAGSSTQPADPAEEEDEAINVGHVISYCALDYPRIVDSVRWRLHTIRQNLSRESKNKDTEQKYKCPNLPCGKEYSSMDVFDLMTPGTTELRCGICGTPIELLMADGRTGTADERKERIKRAKELLQRYDSMLGPLTKLLDSINDITAPDFSNYHTWLSNQANIRSHIAAMDKGAANGSRPNGPTPKPVFTANTQVVLSFDNVKVSEADNGNAASATAAGVPGRDTWAPGPAGAAAAGTSADGLKPVPPFLQNGLASNARPATTGRKPLPPWLASSLAQQQQQQQQQQQPDNLSGLGSGMPLNVDPSGVKEDPEEKPELKSVQPGIKSEAIAEQEPNGLAAMEEDDEWEDATAATEPAAAPSVGAPAAETVTAEEDEWEEV